MKNVLIELDKDISDSFKTIWNINAEKDIYKDMRCTNDVIDRVMSNSVHEEDNLEFEVGYLKGMERAVELIKEWVNSKEYSDRKEEADGQWEITSVSKEDLAGIGYDVSVVDDSTMKRLASKMADAYCENGFWIDLPIIADYLDIPKSKCPKCGSANIEVLDDADTDEPDAKQCADCKHLFNL